VLLGQVCLRVTTRTLSLSSNTGYPRLSSLLKIITFLSSFVFVFFSLLDQTVEKQAENLRSISSRFEYDKKHWAAAINSLHEKIKVCNRMLLGLTYQNHPKTGFNRTSF
jgi:hypothetical protein